MLLDGFDTVADWVPMAAAVVTGAVIGFERELMAKAAGVRTHTLVCFASALLMMAAARQDAWTFDAIPGSNVVADPTRMAHGVLTGIGFLCAGVIFRQGSAIHGLTTAASLWMVAALGLLYGAGLFWLGIAGSVATLVVLVLFRILHLALPDRTEVHLHLACRGSDDGAVTAILARRALRMGPVDIVRERTPDSADGDIEMRLDVILWLRNSRDVALLDGELMALPGVRRLSLAPRPVPTRDGTP